VLSQPVPLGTKGKLDAVIVGLAVVDIIGRPVDLTHPPKAGSLEIIESVTLTTGGNVSNTGIDLAKMGFAVGAITRVGNDGLGEFIRQRYDAHGLDTSGVIVDKKKQTGMPDQLFGQKCSRPAGSYRASAHTGIRIPGVASRVRAGTSETFPHH